MFNKEDIIARLQKGEDIQNIAAEFTSTLNEANRQYESQKEKEKQKAEEIQKLKREEFDEIVNSVRDWLYEYYDIDEDVDFDKTYEVVESLIELSKSCKTFSLKFMPELAKPKAKTSADAVLDHFLKNMGW